MHRPSSIYPYNFTMPFTTDTKQGQYKLLIYDSVKKTGGGMLYSWKLEFWFSAAATPSTTLPPSTSTTDLNATSTVSGLASERATGRIHLYDAS